MLVCVMRMQPVSVADLPYGWRVRGDRIEIDVREREAIIYAFQCRSNHGKGLRSIPKVVAMLNKRYPGRARGAAWTCAGVRRILGRGWPGYPTYRPIKRLRKD